MNSNPNFRIYSRKSYSFAMPLEITSYVHCCLLIDLASSKIHITNRVIGRCDLAVIRRSKMPLLSSESFRHTLISVMKAGYPMMSRYWLRRLLSLVVSEFPISDPVAISLWLRRKVTNRENMPFPEGRKLWRNRASYVMETPPGIPIRRIGR